MTPQEIRSLEAEIAHLRSKLERQDGGASPVQRAGMRSTAAKHDVLFSAAEKTRMPMILTDPRQADDPIIFANRAFQDLTGYGSDELIGRNCRFLQGPETDPKQIADIRDAIKHDRDIVLTITNHRRDGTPFSNELFISPVFDEEGRLLYRFASQVDVTDVRRDSEARKLSELRYRTLFNTIDDGFCVIQFFDGPHGPSSDYVHIEANPGYERHTGIADIVGRTLREIAPTEADAWAALYGGVLRTGEPLHVTRDFEAVGRHIEVSATRIEPASRRQVSVLFRDVTARKAAEAELKRLNETLELRVAEALAERKVLADTVEGTDAFVQVVDMDMRWLAINRSASREFERIFGVRPKVGDSMLEALADQPEQHEAVRAVWARALAGEDFNEIARFGLPTRDQRDYEMRFGVLRNADGRQIGAYQFVYDISDRLKEQARLLETEEALRQSQKMEAVGQLTGGVAHDFNNLLTIIRSSVDFLKRPDLSEERRQKYVGAVADTVDRAAKLTGQLLAFARRQTLSPEVFDVVARVQGIIDMLDTVTGSRIRVVTALPDASCFVRADPSQFETAIVNMAVNARDAMDGEGTLTIGVACHRALPSIRRHHGSPGPFTAITIADTGTGIASDALDRIFEPFFTTKTIGKGTGLGLSQVFGFAKQSGGDIDVASEHGRGTTFTLYVPQVPADEARIPLPPAAAEPSPRDMSLSILVVEDNVEVGRLATQILQDMGNRTAWAPNAEAALEELAREPSRFDAVFSDVMMPGMGGVELARELARRRPDLPVVLTSGYSEVLAQEGGQEFRLVHKPYSAKDIERVLHEIMALGCGAKDEVAAPRR